MMESTTNGDENIASLEDESPFGDGEKIMEGVEVGTDEDRAAEEARKEEIRQQMTKVCQCPLANWFLLTLLLYFTREKPLQSLRR